MDPTAITANVAKLAEKVKTDNPVQALFGAPVMVGTRSVVPVGALVSVCSGGGGGVPFIGGGGVNVVQRVLPIGYLYETDGEIRFGRIELPPGLERGREPRRPPPAQGPGWIERLRERVEKALGGLA